MNDSNLVIGQPDATALLVWRGPAPSGREAAARGAAERRAAALARLALVRRPAAAKVSR